MARFEYTFSSGAVFRVFDGYCETVFADGTIAPAIAMESQQDFAEKLGYNTAWQMVVDHEFLHSYLSELKGKPSKVLWDVAHRVLESEEHYQEEDIVLELQKVLNQLRGLKM